MRGISALTALALTVEIGDWSRFTGSSIGAYVGLVPSEFSSGNSRAQDDDSDAVAVARELAGWCWSLATMQ